MLLLVVSFVSFAALAGGEQKFSPADESCGLSQWAGSGPGFHVNTEAEPPMGRESLCMGRG